MQRLNLGPIERYGCVTASDGRSNEIFITPEARFLAKLRSASKVVVEAEFYEEGDQQLNFSVKGLKWE